MNKRGEEGSSAGIGKIITAIIVIVLLILVLVFITNPAARDYIRNLPSFGHVNDTSIDEVVEDKLVEGVNPCPVQIGYLAIPPKGNGIFKKFFGGDRYHIFAGKTETNLFISDLHNERADIWLLDTRYILGIIPRENDISVGFVSDSIFDASSGIKKRRLLIAKPYSDRDSRIKYPNLPYYDDMNKIQDSYIYNDNNFGGIKLCKEK